MTAFLWRARVLRRYWKLAAVSCFSLSIALALGIIGLGVPNTFFALPPAVSAPDRLVMIGSRYGSSAAGLVSYPDYDYFRKNNHVFTDIAAAPNSIGALGDFNFEGRQVSLLSRPVSGNYFAVLGIHPFLGRLFSESDDADAQIAVMTYSCWQRLGADPHIIGKTLAAHHIIGVTPPGFSGAFYGVEGDLFTALFPYDSSPWRTDRTARRLSLSARFKSGVSKRQAQAELSGLSAQLASAYPREDRGWTAVVTRATALPPDAIGTAELMSSILVALLLLVLLLACANVANLLLAVAVGRTQEAAIKLALGAGRRRLIRDSLTESLVLCSFGGAFGYLIARAAIARFSSFSVTLPTMGVFSFSFHPRLDAMVLGFAVLLIVIATLATGFPSALHASSLHLAEILGGEMVASGKHRRMRGNILVAIQVAVCTLVLVGLGLCQRSLYNLRHVDLGFSARNLIAHTVLLQAEGYNEVRGKQLYQTLRRTAAAIPGVEAVTLAANLPLMGASAGPVQIPGGAKTISVGQSVVDANYFSTLGMPIVRGRPFSPSEREGSPPVVIVNQKMADLFWPGEDPIGKIVSAGNPMQNVTVVGVSANGKYEDLDELPQPFLYLPLSQHYLGYINVVVRTKGDPRRWSAPLTQALRNLRFKILFQPATLNDWMNLTLFRQRVAAGCFAILGALALLLSALGLFAAVSYSIRDRKKELAVRVALGSSPRQLLMMVLRETLSVAAVGVCVGILLGVSATMIFRSQLYGVRLAEWTSLAPAAGAMLLVSVLIGCISARRWIRTEPMEAIRHV
ncbi:MAG TPA: ABC transporter permease [Bryobacteraceae bacterium]|jgi:predicted permease